MLELHPLIIRLALDRSFSWDFGARTKNFGHLLIDTVRFPLRPADFEEGILGRIDKRKKIVFFLMFLQKSVIRIVFLRFPLFPYLLFLKSYVF